MKKTNILKKIKGKIEWEAGKRNFERIVQKQIKYGNKYSIVSVNGIAYIYNVQDKYIPRKMHILKENFSMKEIVSFFSLTLKYYDSREVSKDGIFLDIGANIGTTSIYIAKNINPLLKIIAFEPDVENCQILKANSVLNGCNNIFIENRGISNERKTEKMVIVDDNRGANYILKSQGGVTELKHDSKIENIKVISIDDYLKENNIASSEISYIWIDTEGFEPFVIDGMMSLLSKRKIPMFMEISGEILVEKLENFDLLYSNIVKVYSHFLVVEGETVSKEMHIKNLKKLVEKARTYNIFLY